MKQMISTHRNKIINAAIILTLAIWIGAAVVKLIVNRF
jgi:hypothetical protein